MPGLAYIVSEARAQAYTQAQACSHSFHASRLSGLASEHFWDGKFKVYHNAQQTQLFLLAAGRQQGPTYKLVLPSAAAGTASQSQQAQSTDALCANHEALSQGSSEPSGFARRSLLADLCCKCNSDIARDRESLAQHRSLLSPAAHWTVALARSQPRKRGTQVIYWTSSGTPPSFCIQGLAKFSSNGSFIFIHITHHLKEHLSFWMDLFSVYMFHKTSF